PSGPRFAGKAQSGPQDLARRVLVPRQAQTACRALVPALAERLRDVGAARTTPLGGAGRVHSHGSPTGTLGRSSRRDFVIHRRDACFVIQGRFKRDCRTGDHSTGGGQLLELHGEARSLAFYKQVREHRLKGGGSLTGSESEPIDRLSLWARILGA